MRNFDRLKKDHLYRVLQRNIGDTYHFVNNYIFAYINVSFTFRFEILIITMFVWLTESEINYFATFSRLLNSVSPTREIIFIKGIFFILIIKYSKLSKLFQKFKDKMQKITKLFATG